MKSKISIMNQINGMWIRRQEIVNDSFLVSLCSFLLVAQQHARIDQKDVNENEENFVSFDVYFIRKPMTMTRYQDQQQYALEWPGWLVSVQEYINVRWSSIQKS